MNNFTTLPSTVKTQLNIETVQKSLAELRTQETKLQNELVRLNLLSQFQQKGITRKTSAGFWVGSDY